MLCRVLIAGGTGTGIFYDVIHLLEKRLNHILDGVEVDISFNPTSFSIC